MSPRVLRWAIRSAIGLFRIRDREGVPGLEFDIYTTRRTPTLQYCVLNPGPETRDSKPEIQNLTQTLNPKPQNPNPKPQTPDPKPQTPTQVGSGWGGGNSGSNEGRTLHPVPHRHVSFLLLNASSLSSIFISSLSPIFALHNTGG